MFTLRKILRQAQPLDPPGGRAFPDIVEESISLLQQNVAITVEPTTNQRELRYPGRSHSYDGLRATVLGEKPLPGCYSAVASRCVLRSPLRVFSLGSKTTGNTTVRQLALLSAFEASEDHPWLAGIAYVEVEESGRRPIAVSATFEWLRTADALRAALGDLFKKTQSAAGLVQAPINVLWLGEPLGDGWREVHARLATAGARVETPRSPRRFVRPLADAESRRPHDVLVVWEQQAHGLEPIVDSWRSATGRTPVIVAGVELAEVVAEAVDALEEFEEPSVVEADVRPPVKGEERYYIKHYGSKVGDRMLRVVDCGHGRWGSGARSSAPRALMGIEYLEGCSPTALHRCQQCAKNRWRARF